MPKVIALFLSKDMLPEVRLKDKKTAQINSLANTRDKLVKLRTALKNKIHNILSSHGILLKKESLSSEKGLKRIFEHPVDPVAHVELEVIVTQIRSLNAYSGLSLIALLLLEHQHLLPHDE